MSNLIVWPKAESVVHVNYHYTQFGEIVDYLDTSFPKKIMPVDCDVTDTDVIQLIRNNKVRNVVMHVNYENAKNAFNMAKKIKEEFKDVGILAYGPITTMLPKLFLNSDFDAIYKNGDIETCMEYFLKYYNREDSIQENCRKLKGVSLVQGDEFVQTEKGKFIEPNRWGMSREERVPVADYDRMKGKNRYVINISRGCPFGCPHCLIQLTEGRRERRRSVDNVKEVIAQIHSKYKHIKIWAANFTLDKKYVREFCEMMKDNYPDVTWECATRIDLVKDKEMLQQMHDAGCRQISLGIESLNNDELIHTKDFNVGDIHTAISNIQGAGIGVKSCIMLGMPNQDKRSIVNTLKFLTEHKVAGIRPTIYTPYHTLSEDANIDALSEYNRKTYGNTNVPGVSNEQLLQLVKNPYGYKEILGIDESEQGINPRDILVLTREAMRENPGYIIYLNGMKIKKQSYT